jgi:hypothetical protein
LLHQGRHHGIPRQPGGGEGKKLKDAARYWAAAGGEKDETEDDARLMGIVLPPSAEESDEFEVWDDNWDIVMMFLRMQTQWNVVMGGFTGLKYEVLRWLCDLYSVEDPKAMLEGIQIMEAAALEELNKNDG